MDTHGHIKLYQKNQAHELIGHAGPRNNATPSPELYKRKDA
jgi:hypothetical protein